jgi:hypothetical protein
MQTYHLFASKDSQDREMIRKDVVPTLVKMDEELAFHQKYQSTTVKSSVSGALNYVLPILEKYDVFERFHLKYYYFLVDYLFFTPVILELNPVELIPEIADICATNLKPFVILHELAVLSWYDEILDPDTIFVRLSRYDLSLKETFHILGEVSLRFPEEVIRFQHTEKLLDDYYQTRLIKKLRTARKKDLNKDMEISLSLDEINQLVDEYLE